MAQESCVACGCCVKVCPLQAIEIVRGVMAQVRQDKCVGCGKCVEACPMHVMVLSPEVGKASKCIACGICVKACPMEVLEIRES